MEERARRREARRVPAWQRLSTPVHCSEEVAMPAPRVMAHAPVDKELARLTATPLSPEIESTLLPARFHQPKFTLYDGKNGSVHARESLPTSNGWPPAQ